MRTAVSRVILFLEYCTRFLLGGLWYGRLTQNVDKNEGVILKDSKQSTLSSLLRDIDKDILRKKKEKDVAVGVDLSWVEKVLDILNVCVISNESLYECSKEDRDLIKSKRLMFGTVLALKVLDAQKCVDTFRTLCACLCAMSVVVYFVLNNVGGDDVGSLFLPFLFLFMYAVLFCLVCMSGISAAKQFCSTIRLIKKDSDELHEHLWNSVVGLKNITKRKAINGQVKALQEVSGVSVRHVKTTAL